MNFVTFYNIAKFLRKIANIDNFHKKLLISLIAFPTLIEHFEVKVLLKDILIRNSIKISQKDNRNFEILFDLLVFKENCFCNQMTVTNLFR